MRAWKSPRPVSFVLLGLAAAAHLNAADNPDLSRVLPVPANTPIPVMDFFRPRALQQPSLNPSGTHIAALFAAGKDRTELLVTDLKTQKTEGVAGGGDRDIYRVDWLNDRRLIFQVAKDKLWVDGMYAAEVGAIADAYSVLENIDIRLVSVPTQSRLRPVVWHRYDSEINRDGAVAVINTEKRSAGLVFDDGVSFSERNEKNVAARYPLPKSGTAYGYLADKAGQLEFTFLADDGRLKMQRLEGREWVDCPVDLEEIDVLGCGNEPGQLVVRGPRQGDKPRAVQFMDGTTGRLGDVLLQDKAYDFTGWLYRDPATRAVVGAVYERNGPKVTWFNDDYLGLQKVLDGFFPGLVVRIIGSNEARKIFLVDTYSDRQPSVYNWVNLESGTVGLIKKSAPWIDPARMQPMNMMRFRTRDGRQLDAYVTLPAGTSKKNPAPLVVLSHGGPWVRDGWGFNGEVQFLASRGYAVLQTNYRGSPGYGWMFPREDEWDFRKMSDDVTDATKALVATGTVDGGRIAIMGGSFGGYLALAGVVNEPGLYRCAIAIAGVFDWEQQLNADKYSKYEDGNYDYMLRKLGDPAKEPARFDAISPGRHVDRIRVPVFVAGGTDDHTVAIQQSKRLIAELDKHNVPHETMVVREEGHGMGHLTHQVELYSRIEAFLAKNLGPAK